MRLARFNDSRLGLIDGSTLRDVTSALDALPAYRYPLPTHDVMIANLAAIAGLIREFAAEAPSLLMGDARLLSPVANPGKVIAAPVNYQKHLDEVKGDAALNQGNAAHTITIQKAGLFLKATSSLAGPGEGIALRFLDRRNDHEVELALIIG